MKKITLLIFALFVFGLFSHNALGQDCHYITKLAVNQFIPRSAEATTYFETYYPDETWDFMCEVDSIVCREKNNPTNVGWKLTFERNSNRDLLNLYFFEGGSQEPIGGSLFDWDYNASTVTITDGDFDNSIWIPFGKTEIDFSGSNIIEENREFAWDDNNAQWVAGDVEVWEYNSYDKISTITTTESNGDMQYSKYEYTYTASEKVQTSSSFSRNDISAPWEEGERLTFAYNNEGKNHTLYESWQDNIAQWCSFVALSTPLQNGFPTSYEIETVQSNCGQLEDVGTHYQLEWNVSEGWLLQMCDLSEMTVYNFYYDGISTSTGIHLSDRLSFRLPNPISQGQFFQLEGLPINKNYQLLWLDLSGKIHANQVVSNVGNIQVQIPKVPSSIYFLRIQDLETGNFGTQKVIIHQP